ncbi:MAG TPA: hypothetical protein VHT27_13405 [Solirubrobacteraceae bacterium]|nr:hypothetical protein [Solirubrobacteraceae bacterium]
MRASGLSVGIASAAQGPYSLTQLLLDLTQGSRVAASDYAQERPPPLVPLASGHGAVIAGWNSARARAEGAPATLRAGLLAGLVPGGAGYVGRALGAGAIAAADEHGSVRAISLGTAATIRSRIAAMMSRRALVVAELPGGAAGASDLRALAASRTANELLIALQRAPDGSDGALLWIGGAGVPGRGSELTSSGTRERGLVNAIDIAPTVLRRLGLHAPEDAIAGSAIGGAAGGPPLAPLMRRLEEIPGRRLPALAALVAAWLLLVAAASCAGRALRARAVRAGAIGVLWAPVVSLLPAALAPGAAAEYAILAAGCLSLGALSDLLLRWPRALVAPALAAVTCLAADALAGSGLLMRSLLGPDPAGGARFHGIGNELKSGLAALVLLACATAAGPAAARRRARVLFALAGAGLALVEGLPGLGAGIGGAVLVCAAFALACVIITPTGAQRRAALAVLVCGGAALVPLLALALPHGILHAHSWGAAEDVLDRRYGAAWRELLDPGMAAATLLAAAAALLAIRERARLLAPLAGSPAAAAAFAGALLGGLVGALVEDSGPLLLVEAVAVLACASAYLHARSERAVAAAEPLALPLVPHVIGAASELAPSARPPIAVLGGREESA